jgi:hypothetical protein
MYLYLPRKKWKHVFIFMFFIFMFFIFILVDFFMEVYFYVNEG